eukprot:gnl/MRDRNA2_/MRDRNA2_122651_c0_seq1.p1 gnl/MRDRNA2_/MRDRNA2_122651_c0~~gnl/MRDRNA2_/MRDRNA2_122651_c0_seq1.p1  ORF type:complete len:761 (+),score=132.84 gnl/MRDRNA2_/MRDRNA2_122651_c0_seq1:37-2319(+)
MTGVLKQVGNGTGSSSSYKSQAVCLRICRIEVYLPATEIEMVRRNELCGVLHIGHTIILPPQAATVCSGFDPCRDRKNTTPTVRILWRSLEQIVDVTVASKHELMLLPIRLFLLRDEALQSAPSLLEDLKHALEIGDGPGSARLLGVFRMRLRCSAGPSGKLSCDISSDDFQGTDNNLFGSCRMTGEFVEPSGPAATWKGASSKPRQHPNSVEQRCRGAPESAIPHCAPHHPHKAWPKSYITHAHLWLELRAALREYKEMFSGPARSEASKRKSMQKVRSVPVLHRSTSSWNSQESGEQKSVLKLQGGDSVMAASTPLMVEAAVLDLCGLSTEAAEKLHEGIVHRTLSSPSLRRGTGLPYEKRLFTVKQYREEMAKRAPDLRLVLPAHKVRGYRWRCPAPKHSFDFFTSGAEVQETGLRMLMETEVGHLSRPSKVDEGEQDGEVTLKLVAFSGQHIPPYTGALLRAVLRCNGEVRGEWHSTPKPGGWPVWLEVFVMKVLLKAAESRVLELQIVSENGVGKVVAKGCLHLPYKSGQIQFCSVKLDLGSDSELTSEVHPSVLLSYSFETEDAALRVELLKESETDHEAEDVAEDLDYSVPSTLVLGRLGIKVVGVLVDEPLLQMGAVQLMVAVAPNEVMEKHTRQHVLFDVAAGSQWEEDFSFLLNWPQEFKSHQFLNVGLQADEGTVVLADTELSEQLVAHFGGGHSNCLLDGSCKIPLMMPSGKVQVLVEWAWRPWEMLCVDSLSTTTISESTARVRLKT